MEFTNEVLWIIVAVICILIEAATLGLTTIWFAIGAIFAWIVTEFNAPIIVQVLVFLITSGVVLYFVRPVAQRVLKIGNVRTNADSLVGKIAVVIKEINSYEGVGQVKVAGKIWSAKSYDNEVIERDSKVEIIEIQGVKLVVKKINI